MAEEEEAAEGITIGTAEADFRTPVLASSTAKIVVDSRCQTKVAERDGTVEADREVDRRPGATVDWPSVPRTIRTHAACRHLLREEDRDMAAVAVTIKETEPATSTHRTTTNPFLRWEVNRLG